MKLCELISHMQTVDSDVVAILHSAFQQQLRKKLERDVSFRLCTTITNAACKVRAGFIKSRVRPFCHELSEKQM
jgi:hypothetical protein